MGTEASLDSYGEDDKQEGDHPHARKKSKLVVAPHQKAQQIRSNKHRLSGIAPGITAAISAQNRMFERQLQENRESEKRMLEFREREAESERQHEY